MEPVAAEAAAEYQVLETPSGGIPELIRTPSALEDAISQLCNGHGSLAIDTERAQGFRYSSKAYLIQLRREGTGTFLIDPIGLENGNNRADLSEAAAALQDVEWVFHAASQDLPCLAEINFLPKQLFDTELAARLLNIPKVNLNALTQLALGITLKKEHSAADWSKRPLPTDWLNYAVLDVELLVPLRDWVDTELRKAGKREWASEEFDHLVRNGACTAEPKPDPWRHTSGLHQLRSRRAMAVVQELWETRDRLAQSLDRGPARLLSDHSLIAIAALFENTVPQINRKLFTVVSDYRTKKNIHKYETAWLNALRKAADLPDAKLPKRSNLDGIAKLKSLKEKYPQSAARWERVRAVVTTMAEKYDVPSENLIAPAALRALIWENPAMVDRETLLVTMRQLKVRPWQLELVGEPIWAVWN